MLLLYSEFEMLNILCGSYQDIRMQRRILPHVTINICRGEQMHRREMKSTWVRFAEQVWLNHKGAEEEGWILLPPHITTFPPLQVFETVFIIAEGEGSQRVG